MAKRFRLIFTLLIGISAVFFCTTKEKDTHSPQFLSVAKKNISESFQSTPQQDWDFLKIISPDVEYKDDTSSPNLPDGSCHSIIPRISFLDLTTNKNLNALAEIHIPLYILHQSFRTHIS